MLVLNLPSPVWPLPIALDSWAWHSRFLWNIVLYSIGLDFHHQTLPQLGIVSAQKGSASSFFLELFLRSSPVAYWAPTNLKSSSFHVISFCLFILFMGFSRQEYWRGLCSLLQWTTFCQNSPPWLLDSINRHDTFNITSLFLSLFLRKSEPWNKKNCL